MRSAALEEHPAEAGFEGRFAEGEEESGLNFYVANTELVFLNT